MTQRAIPCMVMRAGTSRGPFFLLEDLPADPEVRDRVLLAAMGSPDPRLIDGVPGTGAPVVLRFSDVAGSKCGAMFPTGAVREEIDGVAVSCVDVAMPMVMMLAGDLGISGYDPGEITGNSMLMRRIEQIRLEAGGRMGLGDVTESVVPKVGI